MSPYTSDFDYEPGWPTFKAILLAPFKGLCFVIFLPVVGFVLCFVTLMDIAYEAFTDSIAFWSRKLS